MPKKASFAGRCVLPFLLSILPLLGLRTAAAADDTIQVGVLHSITGVTAAEEAQLKDFVFFLVKEQNERGGVLGKKLTAIAMDAQSNPAAFNARANELIVREKVSVVFGGWGRTSLFAMAPVFRANDTILFYPANILNLDSVPKERTIFYAGFFPEQLAKAAITYMSSSANPSLWALLGNESSEAGAMNAMMRSILTTSRRVQDADVLSMNIGTSSSELARAASDIASFSQSRRPTGPTAVLTTLQGLGDVTIFGDPRYRMDPSRFPTLSLTLRESQLSASSNRGQLGIVDYYQGVATPANSDLLRRWRAYTRNPNSPVDDAMASYATAFAMWVKAVEKAQTVESPKVIDALPGIAVETLTGSMSMMLPEHRITKHARVVRVNAAGKFELVWTEGDERRSAPSGVGGPPSAPATQSFSTPMPSVAITPPNPSPRASIEQTQPGTDAGGKADLPANSNAPSDSAPILAAPTLMAAATGTDSAGSARRCATPTTPSIPTTDEFQRSTNSPVYCREGFQDVVLIDTGDEAQAVRDRVCSGVRVGSDWILTAKHCVAKWTATRGRIFALTDAAFGCLDRPPFPEKHPGESCNLPVVERNGQPTQAEDPARKIDLALIRVVAPPDAPAPSLAKVRRFVQSGTLEITLAGFGAAPGAAPGTLRVGWSRIVEATALRSMTEETELNLAEIAVPIRFTQRSYGAGSPGSWACKGDSGSPVFAGRVFGYRNEPHLVAGIVTDSSFVTAARCASDAAMHGDSTKIVPLMHPVVGQWLCNTTSNNLDLCR